MTGYGATLAYDGSAYYGFQRQPEPRPTIQGAVETAISRVTRQSASVVGAGRTDSGVHAVGQVIAFDVDWKHADGQLLQAINSQLPRDIALQDLWRQAGFHPRYDALWRQYAYRIAAKPVRQPLLNGQVWQLVGQSLNLERMQQAAERLLGEHDFAAFGTAPQAGSSNTVRQVYVSQWTLAAGDYGHIYTYRVRSTAFLYHMVRRMVGLMVQVGRGQITLDDFMAIFASHDIQQAKLLAPPNGLVLEAVHYPPRQARTAMTDETNPRSCAYKNDELQLLARTQVH